jgi:acetoacetyl-CoA synthetase
MQAVGTVLWKPAPAQVQQSHIGRFAMWLSNRQGRSFESYSDLQAWSTEHLEEFWSAVWDWFDLGFNKPTQVLTARVMPDAKWFPGARINYAREVLARAPQSGPALICVNEELAVQEITGQALRQSAESLASSLLALGVHEGDRVVGFLGNTPEAVVSLLACAAVGAVWAACAPDFGAQAVIDRFAQLEPVVLIATGGYHFGGRYHDRREVLDQVRAGLPSLLATVMVPARGSSEARPSFTSGAGTIAWADLLSPRPQSFVYADLPFDHPLWVLYSSGTTGTPKGILHSHGGIVIEHLKSLQFNCDLGPGDRLYFYSSTGWMVWNLMVGALLVGSIVVLYDGSPTFPDQLASWRIAALTRANVFGAGAGYLSATQTRELHPAVELDLSELKAIISAGSPLPPTTWQWIYDEFGAQIRLDSSTGGTDVCGTFISGSPWSPVYLGELSAPCLGVDAHAFDHEGNVVREQVGELVITSPMPSMPIAFWGDPDGTRYHDAYFAMYPGVWRHGDWIEITSRGSVIMRGRSDATLNRGGVRFGSADLYGVVEATPGVSDSLVVGIELPDGGYYMPLFIVADGSVDEPTLREDITSRLREQLSRRHVPDEIVLAPAVPRTRTGKKLEVPIKRILQGTIVEDSVSKGSIDIPDALDWFAAFGEQRVQPLLQPSSSASNRHGG